MYKIRFTGTFWKQDVLILCINSQIWKLSGLTTKPKVFFVRLFQRIAEFLLLDLPSWRAWMWNKVLQTNILAGFYFGLTNKISSGLAKSKGGTYICIRLGRKRKRRQDSRIWGGYRTVCFREEKERKKVALKFCQELKLSYLCIPFADEWREKLKK